MPSVTLLTSGGDTANSDTYVTASVTPTAGRLYLIAVMNSRGSGVGTVAVSGWGLAWEHIGVPEPVTWNSDQRKISILRAAGTPVAGALTIALSIAGSGALWSVFEAGLDATSLASNGAEAVRNIGVNSTGSGNGGVAVTLGAFSNPGNIAIGAFGNLNQEDLLPGSGFTQLSDSNIGSPSSSFMTQYQIGEDTTVDASALGTSAWGAVACELIVTAGGGGTTEFVTAGGTLVVAGAIGRQPQARFTGALSSAGAIVRSASTRAGGGLTSSGALAPARVVVLALAGAVTSTGSLTRAVWVRLTGAVTPAGRTVKQVTVRAAGTLATSGTLATVRAVLLSVGGALASSGALARSAAIVRGGTLATSGAIRRGAHAGLRGTLATGGTVGKAVATTWSGALSLAGTIVTALAGVLNRARAVNRRSVTITTTDEGTRAIDTTDDQTRSIDLEG